MQAISPNTRIVYPGSSSLPDTSLPATNCPDEGPGAYDAFMAQRSVRLAFSGQSTNGMSCTEVDPHFLDTSEDSYPYDDSLRAQEPWIPEDVYIINPQSCLSQRAQLVPHQLTLPERNLIKNLAPGEGLRLGYGSIPGPHFIRMPHPSSRDRIIRACDRCRARKTKCTGEKPICSRCTERGFSCAYSEPRVRGPNKYQEYLRQQKSQRSQSAFIPPPVAPLAHLPPHLVAFDPWIIAHRREQRQNHPATVSTCSSVLATSKSNPTKSSSPVQQAPYRSFALPSNHPPSGPSPEAITSATQALYEQQAPQRFVPRALSAFDEDDDMLFTPRENALAEYDRECTIDDDDNMQVDMMDEASSDEGFTMIDPLAQSPINLPPPLNVDPSGFDWLLEALQESSKPSCDPVGGSFTTTWHPQDYDLDACLVAMSNTSSMCRSHSHSSTSSGSLPTTPPSLGQDVPTHHIQDEFNSKTLAAASALLQSEMLNKELSELSVNVFCDQMEPDGPIMSPSMVFDFESYESS